MPYSVAAAKENYAMLINLRLLVSMHGDVHISVQKHSCIELLAVRISHGIRQQP